MRARFLCPPTYAAFVMMYCAGGVFLGRLADGAGPGRSLVLSPALNWPEPGRAGSGRVGSGVGRGGSFRPGGAYGSELIVRRGLAFEMSSYRSVESNGR